MHERCQYCCQKVKLYAAIAVIGLYHSDMFEHALNAF